MSSFYPSRISAIFRLLGLVTVSLLIVSSLALPQTSVSTGGIVGTVQDPQGAVVPGAKVIITNLGTNQSITVTTTSAGLYNSGSVVPGNYKVRVEAKGFSTSELAVTVEVGAISPGNIKLELGQESQVVEVQGSAVAVNTEQATVQGVVTTEQIENLPINGRNFLDLAQLEPGVQIQDGAGFDPTKNGFSSLSIGGRAGRTARIEVDGIDISDENVGTTTQNISAASIQEFQIAQSSLDLSSSLTSSGSVNVTTKSGTNNLHGSGFYDFRDRDAGFAALPGGISPYFQRNQSGGNLGGPILKDKLFFFLNVEHSKQDFGNAVAASAPFTGLAGSYSAPYRDTDYLGKIDWALRNNVRLFYRFTYNDNSDLRPAPDYSPFLNRDNTPGHAVGLDFNTGTFTHSVRFGDSKFQNHISPFTGGGLINPNPALNMLIGSFATGPNSLAPQATFQQNRQVKYDGSKPWKNHIFRYGFAFNRIVGNAFASFGANGATLTETAAAQSICNVNPQAPVQGGCSNTTVIGGPYAPALIPGDPYGAADNPLNYPIDTIQVYNGQGYFSEKSSLGIKFGGLFDNRVEFYGGDAWKLRSNLTVSLGLHYVRDTGRTDSDLPPIPFLDNFCAGCGNRVNQPSKNFSPEIGIAWDPAKNGKTVLRAGAGLYYENNVFNNILFDRTLRVASGLTPWTQIFLCGPNGGTVPFPSGNVTSSDGLDINSQICGHAPGQTVNGVNVGQAIIDLQNAFQAATSAAAAASPANPLYVPGLGSLLATPLLLSPNYVSPRSVQINVGFQRQLTRGTVLQVDYLRNVGTHFMLGVDVNHVGAARNFNKANATAAVNATLANCGAATVVQSYSANCANDPANGTNDGGTYVPRPATMADYAANGLDTAGTFANPAAAFPGINASVGNGDMVLPIGRSLYNALQMSLRSSLDRPAPGIKHMNVIVSYALSRFENNIPIGGDLVPGDQDFGSNAVDWDHPLHYFGAAGQDRTHQLSFGPILDFAKGVQFSIIGHLDSPLPLTLDIPQLNGGGVAGEIFRSDFTGDGTVQDVLPGTNVGAFGRSIKASGLNGAINRYNQTYAGQATPAGQAVISSGLMTLADLQALNGVMATIANAPAGNVGLGWLKSIDMRLAWNYKIAERVSIQPSITAFNAFNFANFDGPFNLPSGILLGAPGFSINNLTSQSTCPAASCRSGDRVAPGSGTFSLGAPRQLEFGLKVTF